MIRSYFSIALRNFRKNAVFSIINMAGLAIGISAALVIYLIVQYEFSFDKHHKDGDRIFRVVTRIKFSDMTLNNSGVPFPTPAAARNEIPGLEEVTHFNTEYETKVEIPTASGSKPLLFRRQADIVYSDNHYFNIFEYDWVAGNSKLALSEPFKVVLTESRAKAYFGNTPAADIIGREIIYSDTIKTVVSGVVKDLDQVTDLRFKEFISMATVDKAGLRESRGYSEWGNINSSSQMIVKLKPGVTVAQIQQRFATLREKYRTKDPEDKGDDAANLLQPLTDIHFNIDYDNFDQRKAHRPTLYGLLAVAGFLLLLGCINFINLTTAQATQRAKEIGIRKTLGSSKGKLIFQFLNETFLLTLFATMLSIIITPWLLKIFSDFIPPGVSFSSLNQPHVWLFLVGLMIVVTVLAGLYPAWVLTRFKPVTVLKNQAHSGTAQTRRAWLRKSLTVTQFVIAQFLIIATLVVSKQINYSLSKDLGYKTDAIVSFNVRWNFFSSERDNRRLDLLQRIKQIPGIESISLSGSSPASVNTSTTSMKYVVDGKPPIEAMVEVKHADTSYFKLFNLKLIAGRMLESSDTTKEFIINETYARLLGFQNPADAVGKMIENNKNIPIVGVVRDFHTKSTHEPIKPLAYSSEGNRSYTFHLALPAGKSSAEWRKTMDKVKQEFAKLYPDDEFNYFFYDERIAAFYQAEQNIARLLKWSTGLCIFISCLGLLGLVMFVTNTRTKEIGVRKVLGASVVQLVALLSKDFVALVLIAFVLTLPVAWWAMNNWLQDFVYRTSLSWWIFAASGVGMLLIAIAILSIRTIKSATDNPVKALRTE